MASVTLTVTHIAINCPFSLYYIIYSGFPGKSGNYTFVSQVVKGRTQIQTLRQVKVNKK